MIFIGILIGFLLGVVGMAILTLSRPDNNSGGNDVDTARLDTMIEHDLSLVHMKVGTDWAVMSTQGKVMAIRTTAREAIDTALRKVVNHG